MSEHVTCVEFAINAFHITVSISPLFLQPAVPDVQMFHSARKTSSRQLHLCVSPNSRLQCVNLASFINSLMLIMSLSSLQSACCPVVLLWRCNRQRPTIKYFPDADVLSTSSLVQSLSRYALMLSALSGLGMNVAESCVCLMYLTVFTNCLRDFWFGSLSLLHIHLAVACKSGLRLVMKRIELRTLQTWAAPGDRKAHHLQAQSVSRAWDSPAVGNHSFSSSTAGTLDPCPALSPTCHLRRSPSELPHAQTNCLR